MANGHGRRMTAPLVRERWVSVEREGQSDGIRLHCHTCQLVELLLVDVDTLRTAVGAFLQQHPRRCGTDA
jgi:hypothetical protein